MEKFRNKDLKKSGNWIIGKIGLERKIKLLLTKKMEGDGPVELKINTENSGKAKVEIKRIGGRFGSRTGVGKRDGKGKDYWDYKIILIGRCYPLPNRSSSPQKERI